MSERYFMPRHLDDPPVLFFWRADSVLLVVVFFILGTLLGLTVYLTIVGVFVARLWGRLRADRAGLLLLLFYWYGPVWIALRPPSWIREYVC